MLGSLRDLSDINYLSLIIFSITSVAFVTVSATLVIFSVTLTASLMAFVLLSVVLVVSSHELRRLRDLNGDFMVTFLNSVVFSCDLGGLYGL